MHYIAPLKRQRLRQARGLVLIERSFISSVSNPSSSALPSSARTPLPAVNSESVFPSSPEKLLSRFESLRSTTISPLILPCTSPSDSPEGQRTASVSLNSSPVSTSQWGPLRPSSALSASAASPHRASGWVQQTRFGSASFGGSSLEARCCRCPGRRAATCHLRCFQAGRSLDVRK